MRTTTDIEQLSVADALARCVAIAEERALATGKTSYADGYRAAAEDIRARILVMLGPIEPAGFERDVRDAEIEARTLARVVTLLRREQTRHLSAVARQALANVIEAIDDGAVESAAAAPEAAVSCTRVG